MNTFFLNTLHTSLRRITPLAHAAQGARGLVVLLLAAFALAAPAQNLRNAKLNNLSGMADEETDHFASEDTVETVNVPEGIYAWTVGKRFGDIRPADYDTIPHLFQNENYTGGRTAHYIFTGNLGAPRLSTWFNEQGANMQTTPFFFNLPYDYFLTGPDQLLYTNTKSPFTNLTYHSCGNKTNGEDRLRALFSVNVGKRVGLGFKVDYAYGRGYYDAQSTAHLNGILYGSYRGEQYQMHAYVQHTYLKNRENGGIESDDYVNHPETFPTSYGTSDMPTNLTKAWNKLGGETFYLTHRYSLGFRRGRDAKGNIVPLPKAQPAVVAQPDSAIVLQPDTAAARPRLPRIADDDLADERQKEKDDSTKITVEFVPVSSFIHTLKVNGNSRRFQNNLTGSSTNPGYFRDYYMEADSANDHTEHLGIENTIAVELHEGFNKWMKMGLRLFGKHEFARYRFDLPPLYRAQTTTKFVENYFTVGAQLIEMQNRIIRYNALGELRTTGSDWGEFNVEATAALAIPLRRDSLHFDLSGFVRNERPSFYYRHFYGRNAWWDNADFTKQFHARIGATLRYKETSLTATLENIQNYVYLQEYLEEYQGTETYASYRHAVAAEQASKNVQLVSIALRNALHLGRGGWFNWENELCYQTTTNKAVLPVPALTAYSNLYLKFSIARVLHTELGVDASIFTRYTAPTYAPIIGQYALQDPTFATKTGGYPIVNAYANFHLKRTRFYLKVAHLNYSSGSGRPFLVAHYPMNRMTIHFGISWNFIN